MSKVRRNVAANLLGGIWSSAASLIFIPVYLRYLGVEAYGLVGFYATLQALFGLFDLGIGSTLNRGLARLAGVPDSDGAQRDLLRTFEVVYYATSITLALIVLVAAPVIASKWVNAEHLAQVDLVASIRLMAIVCALQFPFALYQSALIGLQRQVAMNAIAIIATTLRTAGAAAVLVFLSPTVTAFFMWQVVVAGLQAVAVGVLIWRVLGHPVSARFTRSILAAEWRFAAVISANSIVGALLTQADKLALSGAATLQELGYYTVSGTLAAALWFIILPVNTAVYPRFSQLLAQGESASLGETFHKACQTVAVLLLPAGVTIALFAREILLVWTRNAATAAAASRIAPLLVTGTMLYGLTSVPAYLQFAAGWPHLTLYTNVACAIVLVPSAWILSARFGGMGAALVWLVLNAMYFVPTMITLRRVTAVDEKSWWIRDVTVPAAGALAIGFTARRFFPEHPGTAATVAYVASTGIAIFLAVVALSPEVRRTAITVVHRAMRRSAEGATSL